MKNMKWAAGALVFMMGVGAVDYAEANRGRGAQATSSAAATGFAVNRTIGTHTNNFAVGDTAYQISKEVIHTITVQRETIVKIEASSETADTVLVLTNADGTVIENDDFEGFNPRIVARVPAGSYQVRLGLFPFTLETEGAFDVKFTVTEATQAELDQFIAQSAVQEPQEIVEVALAFTGGPTGTIARGQSLSPVVQSGGSNPVTVSPAGEYGWITATEPSYTLQIAPNASGTLKIRVPASDSQQDPLVLAVVEGGEHFFNDDHMGELDAQLEIPVTGGQRVFIYVGTPFMENTPAPTKLELSL